jgi:hypothetical protein
MMIVFAITKISSRMRGILHAQLQPEFESVPSGDGSIIQIMIHSIRSPLGFQYTMNK